MILDMVPSQRRAAHRPSRRHAILDAAMDLFAVQPPAAVTVADIAAQAGMTPAAVYYHFPSKDGILLEALRIYSTELVAEVRRLVHDLPEGGTPGDLFAGLFTWLEERSAASSVYFVSSVGASLEIETVRMQIRTQLVLAFRRLVRRYRMSAAEGAVVATAMVATMETAAGSWLEQDTTFRGLGRRAFLDEVAAQVNRVAGRR